MEFIETPTFTRLVQALLPDEQYHKLQVSMMESPTSGDMIKGSGGIRKLRKRPADSPLFRHRPQRQQLIKATFWPRG